MPSYGPKADALVAELRSLRAEAKKYAQVPHYVQDRIDQAVKAYEEEKEVQKARKAVKPSQIDRLTQQEASVNELKDRVTEANRLAVQSTTEASEASGGSAQLARQKARQDATKATRLYHEYLAAENDLLKSKQSVKKGKSSYAYNLDHKEVQTEHTQIDNVTQTSVSQSQTVLPSPKEIVMPLSPANSHSQMLNDQWVYEDEADAAGDGGAGTDQDVAIVPAPSENLPDDTLHVVKPNSPIVIDEDTPSSESFNPEAHTISEELLEARYWQRLLEDDPIARVISEYENLPITPTKTGLWLSNTNFRRLMEEEWFDDCLITTYLQLAVRDLPNIQLITSTVIHWNITRDQKRLRQTAKADELPELDITASLLIIPACINRDHFVLFVAEFAPGHTKGSIKCYNSLPAGDIATQIYATQISSLFHYLSTKSLSLLAGIDWSVTSEPCIHQPNSNDCGPYVVANAEAVIFGRALLTNANGYRLTMAKRLLSAAMGKLVFEHPEVLSPPETQPKADDLATPEPFQDKESNIDADEPPTLSTSTSEFTCDICWYFEGLEQAEVESHKTTKHSRHPFPCD